MFSASKTSAPAAGGFQIANSLRFRSSASAYLNRTPSVAGNRKTWTWSGWVKRGVLGVEQTIFSSGTSAGDVVILQFASSAGGAADTLNLYTHPNSITTTQVFRDPSSWYHIVWALDTTQATETNRSKLYINGQLVTAISGTYPVQNGDYGVNAAAVPHQICRYTYTGTRYFDGYLAEINFIDGQALTPSSFGETDAVTGVWKPKRYSGTYGTNGFRLNFSNGTSTTTLGNDSSGNGNNWTTNNISLTAGSTYDWMIDSPTPYPGSSYGVGNYCVLNPLATTGMTGITLGGTTSDGNLGWSSSTSATGRSASFYSNPTDNKWYCETYVSALASGTTTLTWGLVASGGANYRYRVPTDTSATAGDILMTAYDPASGKMWYGKNGTWLASGDPAAGTNPAYTLTGSELNGAVFGVAVGTLSSGTTTVATNFGQRPFAYTPPSGFKSLCTQNLSTPSIVNGAAYMAATTYSGTAGTQAITNTVNGVGFQPGFVWIKNRTSATSNVLQDYVRGNYEYLQSNATAAENTNSGYDWFKSFDSSGFTVAYTSSNSTNTTEWNSAGNTYIGWQWKAGGTAVTNTAGSISSQVSANTTAGFSVVTYTGTGANATVGHGLGVAPSMVIVKNRGATGSWGVYHSGLSTPSTALILLDTTAAQSNNATYWNSTSPTSSVFSLGTAWASGTYVAYCFAAIPGYSAFGSYTGNGSADGPFVYCGFRPRWIFYKSTAGNWGVLYDTSENPYNVASQYLIADSSAAQNNGGATNNGVLDILSNGFKLRDNSAQSNSSGISYIYAAFSESPFKSSLAR